MNSVYPNVEVKTQAQLSLVECAVFMVGDAESLSVGGQYCDGLSEGVISSTLQAESFDAKVGHTLLLRPLSHGTLSQALAVGCGKSSPLSVFDFHKVVNATANVVPRLRAKTVVCYFDCLEIEHVSLAQKLRLFAQQLQLAFYRFTQFKSTSDELNSVVESIIFVVDDALLDVAEQAVQEAQAIVSGMVLARDLGNTPANVCTPEFLAQTATALAKTYDPLTVTVWDEKKIIKEGMNAFWSVAEGSEEPPRLITLEYNGADKSQQPIALVGKGVTFDSGGISLKPAAKMDEMKYDMCGAAAVLGTFKTICELGLPVNVVGVVPATENLPSGKSTKPGDIVTSLSKTTIEVLNTDAEGRLILCDALTYVQRFKPQVIIDLATLTGAVLVALGRHPSGLLSNDQALADDLLSAGAQSFDRCWQLPLWEDYQSQLDSPFADLGNIGGPEAGTVTAGCFLSRFVKDQTWAHLDIAGTAWNSGTQKAATGRPVALLTQYILNHIP